MIRFASIALFYLAYCIGVLWISMALAGCDQKSKPEGYERETLYGSALDRAHGDPNNTILGVRFFQGGDDSGDVDPWPPWPEWLASDELFCSLEPPQEACLEPEPSFEGELWVFEFSAVRVSGEPGAFVENRLVQCRKTPSPIETPFTPTPAKSKWILPSGNVGGRAKLPAPPESDALIYFDNATIWPWTREEYPAETRP